MDPEGLIKDKKTLQPANRFAVVCVGSACTTPHDPAQTDAFFILDFLARAGKVLL